jgi:cation diffusion facilitator CzcD-associated flavoprotein CzcO
VATVDGETRDVDVLILATGFKVLDPDSVLTYAVNGPGGKSLTQFWDEHRLQAYEGVSIPGFPNFFTVFGPYGYVGSSYFALIEAQSHHIVRCLKRAHGRRANRVEVTHEANDRYFAKNGDVPLRRASTVEAYWRSRRFPLDDYRFTG